MHVSSKRIKWDGGTPCIKMGDDQLVFVDSYTYLSHVICNDLSDDKDMQRQVRALYSKANSLITHFRLCSEAVRIFLFQMYCYSFIIKGNPFRQNCLISNGAQHSQQQKKII